jgi:hypothetical protein
MKELLDDAARGTWSLRGYGRPDDSEELFNALAQEGLFEGHSESVVRILEPEDKGKGIFIADGLREGIFSHFVVKKIKSPRHIWSESPAVDIEEEDNNLDE